jgi:hypothetical protein
MKAIYKKLSRTTATNNNWENEKWVIYIIILKNEDKI